MKHSKKTMFDAIMMKAAFNYRGWISPLHIGKKPPFRDFFVNRPIEIYNLVPVTEAVSNSSSEWVNSGRTRQPFICTIGRA